MQPPPLSWTPRAFSDFGLVPQVTRHEYHELEEFSRSGLVELLDRYPVRLLRCYTMGSDLSRPEDWQIVDIQPSTSGEDLVTAVEKGRLWLNVLEVERNSPELRELIAAMYRELEQKCPHLGTTRPALSTLLISSPGAMVYYHMDAEPNMLWHLMGKKRIWIYPPMDLRFVPQDKLEDIYARVAGENLPYRAEFDDSATCYLLEPGDVASWPHNAPHRVVNVDFNVSLATSYTNAKVYEREYLQLANKYLLRRFGLRRRSMNEVGPLATAKRFGYRVINKLRPFEKEGRQVVYRTNLRLDASASEGVRRLDEPVTPYFVDASD